MSGKLLLICLFASLTQVLPAQKPAPLLRIEFHLEAFEDDTVFIGREMGNQIIRIDTLALQPQKYFLFQAQNLPPAGVYALILPSGETAAGFLITEKESLFSMKLSPGAPIGSVEFKNAPDNDRFQRYRRYMSIVQPEIDNLNKALVYLEKRGEDTKYQRERLTQLYGGIKEFQDSLIRIDTKALSAALIRTQREPDLPEFKGTAEEVQLRQSAYRRAHYFDGMRGDTRLYPTRFFFDAAATFTGTIADPHPDSLNRAIDTVLSVVQPGKRAFQLFLTHYLEKYNPAAAEGGSDVAYVHLVEQYVRPGKAAFLSETEKQALLKSSERWGGLITGRKAPALSIPRLDLEATLKMTGDENPRKRFRLADTVDLHRIQASLTVLVFWKPDCSSCIESIPGLMAFYDKYHEKGVEILAVCYQDFWGIPECAKTLTDLKAVKWINVSDPYLQSGFPQRYDVRSTPKLYLLGKEKEILVKDLSPEDLEKTVEKYLN